MSPETNDNESKRKTPPAMRSLWVQGWNMPQHQSSSIIVWSLWMLMLVYQRIQRNYQFPTEISEATSSLRHAFSIIISPLLKKCIARVTSAFAGVVLQGPHRTRIVLLNFHCLTVSLSVLWLQGFWFRACPFLDAFSVHATVFYLDHEVSHLTKSTYV